MEKFWNALASLFKKGFASLQFISIIAWLLLWYVITTWLVLGTLSSHQFQQRLTNVVDKQTKEKLFRASTSSSIQSIRKESN
jgi:hypothetical protein